MYIYISLSFWLSMRISMYDTWAIIYLYVYRERERWYFYIFLDSLSFSPQPFRQVLGHSSVGGWGWLPRLWLGGSKAAQGQGVNGRCPMDCWSKGVGLMVSGFLEFRKFSDYGLLGLLPKSPEIRINNFSDTMKQEQNQRRTPIPICHFWNNHMVTRKR